MCLHAQKMHQKMNTHFGIQEYEGELHVVLAVANSVSLSKSQYEDEANTEGKGQKRERGGKQEGKER